MDSKNATEELALVPTDAVCEAAELLRGLLVTLHRISDSLPVAPTIEATSEDVPASAPLRPKRFRRKKRKKEPSEECLTPPTPRSRW